MRKTIVTLLALSLVFGALLAPAAEAKKRKKKKPRRIERVVEIEYQGSGLGVLVPDNPVAGGGGVCFLDPSLPFHCLEVPTKLNERYVKVEVTDQSGMKVAGFLSQGDVDGDGISDGYGNFCGAHEEPAEMTNPGATLSISVYNGTCSDGTPSIATIGTVKLTFSNLP